MIYALKVKCRPIDGWGRDLPMETMTISTYSTYEKAKIVKEERAKNSNSCYCDVGEAWIESVVVQ